MKKNQTLLSVLDLVPIGEGFSIGDALKNSTKLA